MAIHRVHKTKDYTVISNYHLKDKRMTLKTKGLLSLILSLPDDWDYSGEGLEKIVKDGQCAVRSGLKELEELGYLKRSRARENGVICDWVYDIFESPVVENPHVENPHVDNPPVENPHVENPHVDNPPVENRTQLNTKELNTKELNTKELYIGGKKNFTPPTLEEVKAYCAERRNNVDAERWIDHYTANGWMVGKSKMKDWKAAVRTWEKNVYSNNQSTAVINGKTYEVRNGKYYIPGGSGVEVDPYGDDDLMKLFGG